MANLVLCQVCFFLLALSNGVNCKVASVTWEEQNHRFVLHDELMDSAVAWANFTDSVNEEGWTYLEISTNGSYFDAHQAYAAGVIEGHLTRFRMYQHWLNTAADYCKDDQAYCDKLNEFLTVNYDWILQEMGEKAKTDPYWHQVQLIFVQLSGLEDGYHMQINNPNRLNARNFTVDTFIMFQIFGDLEDLEPALGKKVDLLSRLAMGTGRCSGLIKLLPNAADLFVSQVTWNSYQSMLRVLKKYNFQYHFTSDPKSGLIPGNTVSFSSYPGLLYSGDDFYITSSNLVILETTIGNSNPDLLRLIKPYDSVLEWVRNLVANRLATDGQSWTKYFKKYNSGTYNNQWMVVDFNKFQPGILTLKSGLLWILEQIPGTIEAQDQTQLLSQQGYWPSYNLPFYENIFNLSGVPNLVNEFGDWFSYKKHPRAKIFARDHEKIVDLESMTRMMRYNDFKNDPLSKCNCNPPYSAENAISARNDLNLANGTYPFKALNHRSHGGTDMKLTSFGLHSSFEFIAAGGPTYDQLPPFKWSEVDFGATTPHYGHPDLWKFTPVQHQWTLNTNLNKKIIKESNSVHP